MSLPELILIGIGLSMDAFAIAVCAGLGLAKTNFKSALIVGGYFGVAQAVMPFAGYMLANQFAGHASTFGRWIAFVLLCAIGGKMIFGSFKNSSGEALVFSLGVRSMLPLALATSIDALAVGASLAFLHAPIALAVVCIGLTTLLLCMAGVKVGSVFGSRFRTKAELVGGVILVALGVNILLELV